MPLYTVKQRGGDTIRIIEAPNNRAVLVHLAAEMFDVALVKIETVAEEGDGVPVRRRGRPPKDAPPANQDEPQDAKPEAPTPGSPASDDKPAAASDALIEAEAARASGRPNLFEQQLARAQAAAAETADPLVDPETGEIFEKREPAQAGE